MGCDIHALLEKRDGDDWICVNTFTYFRPQASSRVATLHAFPAVGARNYRRFARLAGVRGDGPEPKGLPPDLSQTANYLIREYGSDGHSHSFMPIREAAPIFVETEWFAEGDNSKEWATKFPAAFFFGIEEDEVDEHRLVFWFDN